MRRLFGGELEGKRGAQTVNSSQNKNAHGPDAEGRAKLQKSCGPSGRLHSTLNPSPLYSACAL